MAEDREQDRADERDSAARPVTAAARRERRASARDAAARERGADGSEAKTPETARSRRARDARGSSDATEVVKSSGKAATTASKGRATPSRDRKDKRPSVFARFGHFVREVVSELRKVIWPTRKQQLTYTLVVLVFVAFIVAFVAGLDLGFAKLVFLVFA